MIAPSKLKGILLLFTQTCFCRPSESGAERELNVLQDMFGCVGVPQPGLEFRLESIPEMKYDALDQTSPKGEICIKGSMVSPG